MNYLNLAVATLTSACALHTAADAQSQSGREPVEIRVSVRSVDFNDPRSVADFDQRLARAARAACDSGASYDLGIKMDDARCARTAWAQTVKSLNQPLLSALHGQTTTLAQASTIDRK